MADNHRNSVLEADDDRGVVAGEAAAVDHAVTAQRVLDMLHLFAVREHRSGVARMPGGIVDRVALVKSEIETISDAPRCER